MNANTIIRQNITKDILDILKKDCTIGLSRGTALSYRMPKKRLSYNLNLNLLSPSFDVVVEMVKPYLEELREKGVIYGYSTESAFRLDRMGTIRLFTLDNSSSELECLMLIIVDQDWDSAYQDIISIWEEYGTITCATYNAILAKNISYLFGTKWDILLNIKALVDIYLILENTMVDELDFGKIRKYLQDKEINFAGQSTLEKQFLHDRQLYVDVSRCIAEDERFQFSEKPLNLNPTRVIQTVFDFLYLLKTSENATSSLDSLDTLLSGRKMLYEIWN